MSKVRFIYLSQEEVKRSGGMDMIKAISDVEKVLVVRHKGECVVPHKVVKNREERIFFNPVGMGVQDLMVAHRIYETAKEKGFGQILTLWDQPEWI